MDYLDESTLSPEQKFMLMIDERLIKLEEYIFPSRKGIPDYVKNCIDKYKALDNANTSEKIVKMKEYLKSNLPEHIFSIIKDSDKYYCIERLSNVVKYLNNELHYMSYFTIYNLLEEIGYKATPEFIAWIDENFKDRVLS